MRKKKKDCLQQRPDVGKLLPDMGKGGDLLRPESRTNGKQKISSAHEAGTQNRQCNEQTGQPPGKGVKPAPCA